MECAYFLFAANALRRGRLGNGKSQFCLQSPADAPQLTRCNRAFLAHENSSNVSNEILKLERRTKGLQKHTVPKCANDPVLRGTDGSNIQRKTVQGSLHLIPFEARCVLASVPPYKVSLHFDCSHLDPIYRGEMRGCSKLCFPFDAGFVLADASSSHPETTTSCR